MSTTDLRLGRWQDVLRDVKVNHIITDPPYSAKTHDGHNAMSDADESRRGIQYAALEPSDIYLIVSAWEQMCDGWIVVMTDHILMPEWLLAMERTGRYTFAPVPIIQKRFRKTGDGPSSDAVYLCVSRPRKKQFLSWGSLTGHYLAPLEQNSIVVGAKPAALMQALVSDYSRQGDTVCDPYAGGGSTALACRTLGRNFVGAEINELHYNFAQRRLSEKYTPSMFG